jgi:predicted nucleic-acid-binding protein
MKTVAIDTNVLLDFQKERSPGFAKAKQLIENCLEGRVQIFIPQIVFPELEWVLRSYYKEPKGKIVELFEELLALEGTILKDKIEINQALLIFKERNIKFADAIIFTEVLGFQPDEFLTFDEDLKKLYNENTN